jgi:hypothetical protein
MNALIKKRSEVTAPIRKLVFRPSLFESIVRHARKVEHGNQK